MSKRVKTRKATDDIDRIGIAVLELFADGAADRNDRRGCRQTGGHVGMLAG